MAKEIPAGIKRWSWGAFFLTFIWGIFNKTYIALLCLVPFVNIVMPFVLGAKGNEWAWKNKDWKSVGYFHKVQRRWAIAGVIVLIVFVVYAVGLFMGITAMIKGSEPYEMSLAAVNSSSKVAGSLGEPLEVGYFVAGNVNFDSVKGEAALKYSVEGPEGSGQVYTLAVKERGKWKLDEVVVVLDEDGSEIVVVERS